MLWHVPPHIRATINSKWNKERRRDLRGWNKTEDRTVQLSATLAQGQTKISKIAMHMSVMFNNSIKSRYFSACMCMYVYMYVYVCICVCCRSCQHYFGTSKHLYANKENPSSYMPPYTNQNSKRVGGLNSRAKPTTILEENKKKKLLALCLRIFLRYNTQSLIHKRKKGNELDSINIKNSCPVKTWRE